MLLLQRQKKDRKGNVLICLHEDTANNVFCQRKKDGKCQLHHVDTKKPEDRKRFEAVKKAVENKKKRKLQ